VARARLEKLTVEPLTAERWSDFEALFGERGACGGCWCMYPVLSRKAYEAGKGAVNRRSMRARVRGREEPGILGYVRGEPTAWCSLGPRERFTRLAGSRILAPVDERPVWSIVCFFVARAWRQRGLSLQLIEAACRFAAQRGAHCIEAYPVAPKNDPMPPAFAWTGIASAFFEAGFEEVARRSPTRPIVRRELA
jgi:GNAT superfamily N-acetyltransferase